VPGQRPILPQGPSGLAECQVHLLAVKALIDEGFQQLELNRVQARVATDNHPSRLVVRRLSLEMVCESLTPASVERELGTCVRLLKPTNADVATLTSLFGHASDSNSFGFRSTLWIAL
jgi:hypothetical protein